MTIKLYNADQSGHCHRVRLAAGLMGINLELIPISSLEGARTGDTYLKINPLGQIPAIDDDGFVLVDSIAIIYYLAQKYAPSAHWIPDNLSDKANLLRWFGIASGLIYNGPNTARLIKLFGVERDYDFAVTQSERLFGLMESELSQTVWLVGEHPTLADIACYSYLAVAHEGDLDLQPYSHIRQWKARMEKLDGFVEMTYSS